MGAMRGVAAGAVVALAAALGLAACGGGKDGGDTGGGGTDVVSLDLVFGDLPAPEDRGPADGTVDDGGAGRDPAPADPAPGDGAADENPGPADPGGDPARDPDVDIEVEDPCALPAGFACPCAVNADCASGFCVATAEGKACTRACTEACPAGWVCAQVATVPDVVFQCIPAHPLNCHPCDSSDQCKGPFSGEADLCVSYGDAAGSFCGGACQADGDCPAGASCVDATVAEGGTARQCMRTDGAECPCAPVALGKGTGCSVAGEAGTCRGRRACLAGGLSACDAPVPAPESCNDADDDCDGQTDEDCDGDGIAQNVDNCPLVPNPLQDNLDGDALGDACDADRDGDGVGNDADCDPDDRTVCPACAEACDGKDNDCDGASDEALCDDGIPCTEDRCDGVGLCLNAPDDGACKDDNPCTRDVCDPVAGCRHEGGEASCDDGNPCTEDACDPGAGCLHVPRVGQACDDGLLCTAGDACQDDGACRGTAVTCADDPGTCGARRACNGTEACAATFPGAEAACDDGNACTHDDRCDGAGGCLGTLVACQDDPGTCGVRRTCNGTATCTVTWPGAGSACDDGEACTYADRCDGFGICRGTQITCEDSPGACGAKRTCNGTAQCQVTWPGASSTCDDANPCTYADACDGFGGCRGSTIQCVSDPGPCGVIRSCDGTAQCATKYPGQATACNDGQDCSYDDVCDGGGGCRGTTVDCTSDPGTCGAKRTCNGTANCVVTWPAAGLSCSDGSSCTKNDQCDGEGDCRGTRDCNDNNPCTFDFPNPFPFPPLIPCCFNDPQDAPCTDNDAATIGDACVNGACEPGPRCGNAVCDKSKRETCATCPADCGDCPATEANCTDAWDDDGDGNIDCNDGDCATVAPCNGATCRSDVDVQCGSRLNGQGVSGDDVVGTATPACSSTSLTGRADRVFRFFAEATRGVNFEVLDGGTSDFRIFVLDNVCNPGTACQQAASDTSSSGTVDTTVTTVAGHTYYLVVERTFGSDSYDFEVTCN